MNLKTTLTRIASILTALEYTSGQPVFAANSVYVYMPGDRDDPSWRPPEARITVGAERPYGMHGHRLKVVSLEVVCCVAIQDETGELALRDGHRSGSNTNGAGIESMRAKVLPALKLIDTNAGGAHDTWTRTVESPSEPTFDGYLTKFAVRLESLCEVL